MIATLGFKTWLEEFYDILNIKSSLLLLISFHIIFITKSRNECFIFFFEKLIKKIRSDLSEILLHFARIIHNYFSNKA